MVKARTRWPARVMLSLLFVLVTLAPALAGTVTYTYDEAGRLIRANYGDGQVITYTYDAAGNLLQSQVSAQSTAALSLAKADDPDPVTVGQRLTYRLTVTNDGPETATGVTLTDTLPLGVTFVSASAGCQRSGQTVTCTLGPLANGATVMVTIVVQPPTAGPITNTATGGGIEYDPNLADNTATAGTMVTPSCLRTGSARLKGRVRTAAGRSISGVTMKLSGPGGCGDTTTTDGKGKYQFKKLANGTYTVTPSKGGCSFTPSSQRVTIGGGTATADFTGTCP
ncbi:MAG: DUF11 domain-containing protein [candidate division NC10 bacterium]|nr:DUF11 domain-containing protein [candidate division NC10 bacterium]